jgi:nitrogen-specific signal transduction histidine kinase
MERHGSNGGCNMAQRGARSSPERMTLSLLRHDIKNQLNTIKLSCALLQRRCNEPEAQDSVREIEHAADTINELITRFLGDADAPFLLDPNRDE